MASSSSLSLNQLARNTFQYGLESVSPEKLVQQVVSVNNADHTLVFEDRYQSGATWDSPKQITLKLQDYKHVLVLGAGKATQELVSGLLKVFDKLSTPIPVQVCANYPKGQTLIPMQYNSKLVQCELLEATHPISDAATFAATSKQLSLLQSVPHDTLLIVLLSGGGSALFETTSPNLKTNSGEALTLEDIQNMNNALLMSGANITEINTIRKHVSAVKGGRLSREAMVSSDRIKHLIGLYLSDVVGSDLSSVASGPTCPDKTTFADCESIIRKYGIQNNLPKRIADILSQASQETPKPGDALFDRVQNILIGSAETSALAAQSILTDQGFESVIWSNAIDGEANLFGKNLQTLVVQKLTELVPHAFDLASGTLKRKIALIATGEFTVTLKGKGVGGRNQEMLAGFISSLLTSSAGNGLFSNVDFSVLSCAFDGIEGNSPATGAIVDSTTLERLRETLGNTSNEQIMSFVSQCLENNNTYAIFSQLNDAIITGYTGTNVNDLTLVLLSPKKEIL